MDHDVPVLIAGGGLVGLSLAVFLAQHGITAHLVERRDHTSAVPRGRSLNVRSMEVFRAAGLEPALRGAPPSVLRDFPEIARAATLTGPETFHAVRPAPESYARISPTTPLMVDQNAVEPVLREHADRAGCALRFGTELLSFRQDPAGVTAHLRDLRSGRDRTVRARYLIAADGHRSQIRERLGITTGPAHDSVRYVSIPFAADLGPALRGRRLALCYLQRPAPRTVLTRLDSPERWVLMVPADIVGDDPSQEHCRALVRQAVGWDDAPVRLLRQKDTALDRWELSSWVADRYRDRRVLLAGDAVHVTPPAGGLGGNTGIQDAHNLAWKLALVLRGLAGDALLDTYEEERRPVAVAACAFSLASQRDRTGGTHRPAPADGAPAPAPGDPLAVILGHRYRSAAVAGDHEPGTPTPPAPTPPAPAPVAEWNGDPGSRAPHLPLVRHGARISSLDLYGKHFVLLAGPRADRWARAARSAGLPVPLHVHQLGHDITDPQGAWPRAHGVTDAGAVLVRPDGFVCWRARRPAPDDPEHRLAEVLRRTLALPAADPAAR
ncbi:FAD-dependent monooxygenase [Streptomyces sp. NPDC006193]|uniref:FAD-dependent monooxygenase n=1 Tax=Streptomyces sp. NPDC006193 TaxID=3155717 RepID=UPI0033B6EDF1